MTELPEPYRYVPDKNGEGYLWLTLPDALFSKLPETLQAEGKTLAKKTKFHTTLAYFPEVTSKILNLSAPEIEESLLTSFAKYVAEHPITFHSFRDDLRYAKKDERETIVIRCEVENLEDLYATWEQKFNVKLDRPPSHVTLYTLQPEIGIGINTMDAMESLPHVELPEIRRALGLA